MKLTLEKPSPLAATEVVACEMVRGADFGCVWHHHPEFEITLVKRGDDGAERERLQPSLQELHAPHGAAVCE